MTDHPTDDELEAMGINAPEWQRDFARRVQRGDIHYIMPPRENVLSFNDRVAANKQPAHRYPSSIKVHGRWQDRHPRPPLAIPDPIEQLHTDDRRIIAVVAISILVIIAAAVLLIRHPARDARDTPSRPAPVTCAQQYGAPARLHPCPVVVTP